MPRDQPESNDGSRFQNRFQSTHWSVVLAAGRDDSRAAAAALEKLCGTYWFPLYAFVRRRGHSRDEAADLTQGFFADLLRRDDLKSVDPQKGRFRSFLLAALKHYLANQHDFQNAQKRGGDVATLSIDFEQADRRLSLEPFHEQTAEVVFEREWALTLLERARTAIRDEYDGSGRKADFEELQIFLTGDQPDSYREIAGRLGKTEGAIKVAVHRLRQQFHQRIRREIAETVASEAEIDREIQDLFEALRR